MSSGNLPRTQHPELFRWSPALDPADYVQARYSVTSVHDGEATALGMAMEQSAGTVMIRGYVAPEQVERWSRTSWPPMSTRNSSSRRQRGR